MSHERTSFSSGWRTRAGLVPLWLLLCGAALSNSERLGAHLDDAEAPSVAPAAVRLVDFEREVRPILAEHCFACHGPDSGTRKAELRLDTRDGMFGDRGGYAPFVGGDTSVSEAWLRILDHGDPMPPTDFAKPLDEADLGTLRTWIEQGAAWKGHWSFEPIERSATPAVSNPEWVANAIDAFVLARLDAAELAPAPEADRSSLLRRITFDLTGLPPTPSELDAFLADDAPDAYEKVVDRLLASPAYGERQAQEWLDLSRYADSQGDGKDGPRDMYKWRDWVINAFNTNKPYDQFVIEQIAGDLLPNATLDQKIATGFNRNHFIYTKFGAEKDEYRTAYVVDRVNTTSTVFLGLTVGCAQCHDHKYDPISHEDYYKLFAFFNNVPESDVGSGFGNSKPSLIIAEGETQVRIAEIDQRVTELEEYFESDNAELDAAQVEWESERRAASPTVAWQPLEPVGLLSQNGAHLRVLDDRSILAGGPNPSSDIYHLVTQPGARRIVAFKVEALPHDTLPEGRSGRSMEGTFSLGEFEVHVRSILEGDEGQLLQFITGESTIAASGRSSPDGAVDGQERGGWGVPKNFANEPQEAIFILEEPLVLRDADVLRFTLKQLSNFLYNNTLGHFRISFTEDAHFTQARLPLAPSIWRAVGPFAAKDALAAHEEAFAPEASFGPEVEIDFKAKFDPIDLKARAKEEREAKKKAEADAKEAAKAGAEAPEPAAPAEPAAEPAAEGRATAPIDGETRAQTVDGSAVRTIEVAVPRELVSSIDAVRDAIVRSVATRRLSIEDATVLRRVAITLARRQPRVEDTLARGSARLVDTTTAAVRVEAETESSVAHARVHDELTTAVSRADGAAPEGAPAKDEKPVVKADAKPAAKPAAKPDAADEPEGGGFGGGPPGEGARRGGDREEKLTWAEKREWRLDGSVRLSGRTSAWYLQRTFTPVEERDVILRYAGLDGIKIWLDGAIVFDQAPPAPEAGDEEPEEGMEGAKEANPDEEEGMGFGGFQSEAAEDSKTFEFTLLPGKHELVVKATTGRTGARGTLQFLPLGRDVMPYEVEHALLVTEADSALIEAARTEADESPLAAREEISDFSFDEDGDESLSTPQSRRKWVREWFRRQVFDEGRARFDELAALRQEKSSTERKLPSVMVMSEREQPRETHVLLRGNYATKGQLVEAGVPSVLPPMPEGASNDRVGLAQWIVSGDNPLAARVAVNRYWQQHFGGALVQTPGDFGTRGSLPTHPELLDWLAAEYVANGWDSKAIHRLIVTSNTYRQSAKITPRMLEVDPDNLLLSRAPRGRLSAEMVRDNALAVAGLLSTEVGGKSIKPYQPKGLWEAQGSFQSYKQDKGEKLYRRGIYVYWKRSTLYPSFEAFDAPTRLTCVVERARTTTPLQSLVLLNDPVYVEAARFLGQRMQLEGGSDVSSRIVFGFRMCTSRLPTEEELAILLRIHAEQRALFADDEDSAKKLVAVGETKPDATLDVRDVATWTVMGSVLLNLDATIHKR